MKTEINRSNIVYAPINNNFFIAHLQAQSQLKHNFYLYEMYKNNEASLDKNYKKELCNSYQQGFCLNGMKCRYAHGLCDLIALSNSEFHLNIHDIDLYKIVQVNILNWNKKYKRLPVFEEVTDSQSTNDNTPLNTSIKSNSIKIKKSLNSLQNE